MNRVLFRRASYAVRTLPTAIGELFDRMAPGVFPSGARVLVKPNLLLPAPPESGILTHPLVVRAAVEYLLDQGARPVVADSPATGSFERVLREGGFEDALAGLPVPIRPFAESVRVDVGPPFGRIEMAREVVECDAVVNLAKLKTHSQMLLTLGVKNTFGCIVGLRKPQWHMRSGVDRRLFGRLLAQIHRAIAPALTVIDGVTALEGQGPGKAGVPRELGVMAAGVNAFAVDTAVCRMVGVDPMKLPVLRAGREMGLVVEPSSVEGDFTPVSGFRLPEQGTLLYGPRLLQGIMRRHVTQRPRADPEACRLCGECWKLCPAEAIRPQERRLAIDYDACIRCYCCIEVCPYGAMRAVDTPAGRLIQRLLLRGGPPARPH